MPDCLALIQCLPAAHIADADVLFAVAVCTRQANQLGAVGWCWHAHTVGACRVGRHGLGWNDTLAGTACPDLTAVLDGSGGLAGYDDSGRVAVL